MNTRILTPLIVVLALTGCFDEEKTAPIAPKSMEDCISIENANDRDICRMKMNEKEKKQAEENAKSMESVGEREFKTIDW